jgi:hypothetical protein
MSSEPTMFSLLDLVLDIATADDAAHDHGNAEHDQDGRGEIATDGQNLGHGYLLENG